MSTEQTKALMDHRAETAAAQVMDGAAPDGLTPGRTPFGADPSVLRDTRIDVQVVDPHVG